MVHAPGRLVGVERLAAGDLEVLTRAVFTARGVWLRDQAEQRQGLWRQLTRGDAVARKLCALCGRGAARRVEDVDPVRAQVATACGQRGHRQQPRAALRGPCALVVAEE